MWIIMNETASEMHVEPRIMVHFCPLFSFGKGAKKRKKLTNVSFMYVCVAGNGEMLVFSPNNSF